MLQPFSHKSRTATVPKVFQIGLCGVVEADLELSWDSWSVGFLGEGMYLYGWAADVGTGGGVHTHQEGCCGELVTEFLRARMLIEVYSFY